MHDEDASTTAHVGNVVIVDAAELPSMDPHNQTGGDTDSTNTPPSHHESSESPASHHDQSQPAATEEPDNRHVDIHIVGKCEQFSYLILLTSTLVCIKLIPKINIQTVIV